MTPEKDCLPCARQLSPKGRQRRKFFGSAALLAATGLAAKFIPFTAKAEAVTCGAWVYQYCAKYCDCNCNQYVKYWVYRRLCTGAGNSYYEYYYAGQQYCIGLCGPCGSYWPC